MFFSKGDSALEHLSFLQPTLICYFAKKPAQAGASAKEEMFGVLLRPELCSPQGSVQHCKRGEAVWGADMVGWLVVFSEPLY